MPTYECAKCGLEVKLRMPKSLESVVFPHDTPDSWINQRPEWCKNELMKLKKEPTA